ncbi:hypothetical protein AB4Z45_04330 [Paenibacillus sp. MCAF9]
MQNNPNHGKKFGITKELSDLNLLSSFVFGIRCTAELSSSYLDHLQGIIIATNSSIAISRKIAHIIL